MVGGDEPRSDAPAGRGGAARAKLTARVDAAKSKYEVAQQRRPTVGVLAATMRRAIDARFTILASYLAYRLFLLLPPLMVIVIALAGYQPDASRGASEDLGLGRSITRMIASAGADAHQSRLSC